MLFSGIIFLFSNFIIGAIVSNIILFILVEKIKFSKYFAPLLVF